MSGDEEQNAVDEFLKAKPLMNCEVALILKRKHDQMSQDPNNQVLEKSQEYVRRFSRYKNPDAVRQVREILNGYNLAEFDRCVVGNLCPDSVEEATAIVPSIKPREGQDENELIKRMLNDLSMIKKFE